MHAFKASFILAILLLLSTLGYSQTITVDELYDDWNASMSTYVDGQDTPGGIDLLDMQVTNDDRYLYFKLTVDRELCLGNTLVNHEIWLSIDTDNDPTTGFPEQDGYGTEIAINMNGHFAWFNIPDPNIQVTLGDIGIQMAPTITASTFEIAIPRDIKPDGIHDLFSGDTLRVMFHDDWDNDRMPNPGSVYTYAFQNDLIHNATPVSLEKSSSEHVRIVSHNILFNNGFSSDAIAEMQRVVSALEGDIYCFQECSEGINNIRNLFDSWIPLGGGSWNVASNGGNRVTVSRWPIANSWGLNRKTAHLIDLPDSLSDRDMLLVNGHLSCCTNNSGRQEQVDEFAAFILDAKSQGGNIDVQDSTPIVFVGDMNFVGFNQQYETTLTGDIQNTSTYGQGGFLDWDDTELADARPLHVDSNFVYTWRDLQGDGFPPGRLDFQFYSDAVLTKEKAYILDTERMDSAMLAASNLQQNDTRVIADHLPVVVDYSFPKQSTTSLYEENSVYPSIRVYPNPTTDVLTLDTQIAIERVLIHDLMGNTLLESTNGEQTLQLPTMPRGIYLVQIELENQQPMWVKIIAGIKGK